MDCFFCKSPAAHPATGAELTPRVLACEGCTREFWKWFRAHMHSWGRPGIPDFYAAAARFNALADGSARRLLSGDVEDRHLPGARECLVRLAAQDTRLSRA